jgi:L-asparaginase
MKTLFGTASGPIILIHGGASSSTPLDQIPVRNAAITRMISVLGAELKRGSSALDVVQHAVELFEDSSLFNAGRGSALQEDGVARLSASCMDSIDEKFSAVSLVENCAHPVKLARELQSAKYRTLAGWAMRDLQSHLGIPFEEIGKKKVEAKDTVGAVVRDKFGTLAAATSTGGLSNNVQGRMSDVSSVAGNYASKFAAVGCTGVGEEIVDDALAARIETRIRDGSNVEEACRKSFLEAEKKNRSYGWIAVDAKGDWAACYLTKYMTGAIWYDEQLILTCPNP